MPSHPPDRRLGDGPRWDLDEFERLDAVGFDEAWIGEHSTAAWDPCPAPELLIAQALLRTKQKRLGPLGHLLAYHHPVELVHRVAWRRDAASPVSASTPCRPRTLVRPSPHP